MKKAAYFLTGIACLFLLLEIGLRLVLCVSTGAGFFHPSNIIYKYYPELVPIQQAHISNTDTTLDVLILSCSVLHKDWVDIVTEMNKCIKLPSGFKQIKIYNASGVGHGSRDNMMKYALLKDKQFDVVMYYDAINDCRLNNCPANVFKNDYSHYLWYDEINNIVKHTEMDITVIPFMVDWIKIRRKVLFVKDAYIPKHFSLRPDWMAYGNDFKSLNCYKANLEEVMHQVHQQQAQFLYLSFAYYLPANYSLKKFEAKTLDYNFCDHSRETEIWGEPQNVSRFIDTINTCSKTWVTEKNNRWVDLYAQFPKSGTYFADICHFSPQGIQQFATIACAQLDSIVMLSKK